MPAINHTLANSPTVPGSLAGVCPPRAVHSSGLYRLSSRALHHPQDAAPTRSIHCFCMKGTESPQ